MFFSVCEIIIITHKSYSFYYIQEGGGVCSILVAQIENSWD